MSAVSLLPITSSTLAVGDPSATRTVYLTTIALVLLGIGLAVLAWWLVRRTRPEPELFAPLEQMETRSWRKLGTAERRASLDAVRPSGARPVAVEQLDRDEDVEDVEEVEPVPVKDVEPVEPVPVTEAEPVDDEDVDEGDPVDDPSVDDGLAEDDIDADAPGEVSAVQASAEAEAGADLEPHGDHADDGGAEIIADDHDSEDDPTVAIDRAPST